jgi:uncharacterized membrane protein
MSTGDLAFYGGLALFFAPHFFSIVRKRGEGDLRQKNRGAFMGLYSLVSIAGFVLLIWGYGQLRNTVEIWDPPVWTRHIAMTLMLPALILLAASYSPAGWIKKVAKHPMLAAVKVWAVAHLAANGDLASIVLFGAFLVYAVIDRIAVKRRGDVGAANVTPKLTGDLVAIGIGLAAYAGVLFWFHPQVIGVPILAQG